MKICGHTLVKNDARWLWYSVSSVIEHVDKLLLWDTGSTDGSVEIEKALIKKYPDKILFKNRSQKSAEEFTDVRQEILEATNSDWIITLDADEIWWDTSIRSIISEIKNADKNVESIVVPTINPVGDIFHRQEEAAGRYKLSGKVGHYNLRAVYRKIPGLHSEGAHGVWGWADGEGKMVQDRDPEKIKFVDAPYLHATFLPRGGERSNDLEVIKRAKKLKYEIGEDFPLDYFYPEVFFCDRPDFIESPWNVMSSSFKTRAFFETPLRKIKRRFVRGGVGY